MVALLAFALVLPSAAPAATYEEHKTTPGYETPKTTPSTPATTPATTPTKGTSPAKESKEPTTTGSKEVAPTKTSSTPTPTTTTKTEKASTLPFTGFDLRWSFGIGLLLMGAGFSIMVLQRRQRREGGR